mgnify:CR=1 FL=1
MAKPLTTTQEVDDFVIGVRQQAAHHASEVEKVLEPLKKAVLQRLNLARDTVEVYERNGQVARATWVTLNGARYVFTYNYDAKKIDLRDRTLRGPSRFQFDNTTPLAVLQQIVAGL